MRLCTSVLMVCKVFVYIMVYQYYYCFLVFDWSESVPPNLTYILCNFILIGINNFQNRFIYLGWNYEDVRIFQKDVKYYLEVFDIFDIIYLTKILTWIFYRSLSVIFYFTYIFYPYTFFKWVYLTFNWNTENLHCCHKYF